MVMMTATVMIDLTTIGGGRPTMTPLQHQYGTITINNSDTKNRREMECLLVKSTHRHHHHTNNIMRRGIKRRRKRRPCRNGWTNMTSRRHSYIEPKAALIALCCLWLAPTYESSSSTTTTTTIIPGRASAVSTEETSAANNNNVKYRKHLRKQLRDTPPFRHLQEAEEEEQTFPPSSSSLSSPSSSFPAPQSNNQEEVLMPSSNSWIPPPAEIREPMVASLLARNSYDSAFGKEPLCWKSANYTRRQQIEEATTAFLDINHQLYLSTWNLTGIIEEEDLFLFPNPLVDDFAYLPGSEELLPTCFQNSHLTIQKPVEAQRGERLRTFDTYEFQVNLTIDFTEIISDPHNMRYGDAVLTSTKARSKTSTNNNNNNTQSQVALQVMHCVLGKSGVCIPFLHEQAYAKDLLEHGQIPNASQPGTIHGDTHVHTDFVILDVPANQTYLQKSLFINASVHVEGDYFVLAAVQFYTGNSTTNVAYYRWDMANAMAPQDRTVSYQDRPDIRQVSEEVLLLSYCLIAVASSVILFLIYQAIKHRHEQVLQLCQGEFLIVFLLSALSATVCSFLVEPKNDLYCNIGFRLILLPIQLMYAITAGRLWRINAVISPLLVEHMRQKTKWTNRFVGAVDRISSSITRPLTHRNAILGTPTRDIRRSIPKWQLAVVVAMFVSPQVLLQIAGLIWQPQELIIDYNHDESIGRLTCSSESNNGVGSSILFYGVLTLLALIGVVLFVAYTSRNLPSLFNETQVIYDSTLPSVVLILLGFGIDTLTQAPEISPDVQYMVWVVVTLSITLNSSLRIMIPKLKMIWKGEQVIVSKLVSDHHRKQREKAYNPPPLLRNVTGIEEDFDYNGTSSFNRSLNESGVSMNYDDSMASINYNYHQEDPQYANLSSVGSSSSMNHRHMNLHPQVSTGDMTTKISNLDGRPEAVKAVDTVDAASAPNQEEGQQIAPSEELTATRANISKDTSSTDVEESMDFQELTHWSPAAPEKSRTSAKVVTSSRNKETPESKHEMTAESDTETVNSRNSRNSSKSKRGRRRRRWSPLRKSNNKSPDPQPKKRSSEPQVEGSSEMKKITDQLGAHSDHGGAKPGRRKRWSLSPQRNSQLNDDSLDAKKMAEPGADSDADTVGSKTTRRRLWSPLANTTAHSDSSGRSQDVRAKSGVGKRLSIFNLIGKADVDLTAGVFQAAQFPKRRQTSFPNRRMAPPKRLNRGVSVPKGLGARNNHGRGSGSSSRFRPPRQPERMKVTPEETPARRLVLKMIDLQEQLAAVNRKIISGLVVSAQEWDLLTSLNGKLHSTFENDVDFSWREKAEVQRSIHSNNSRGSNSRKAHNSRNKVSNNSSPANRQGQGTPLRGSTQNPPSQIAIQRSNNSPPPSPKRKRTLLSRGSVTNPAELAVNFRSIIDLRDRRKSIVKHKNCFVGQDAVDALVYNGVASTREEAVQIGKAMVKDMHLFKNVNGDFEFEDDDNLYRFVDLDDCWSSSEEEGEDESMGVLEEEPDLAQKAIAFREAVLTRDRTYRMQTFKSVFIGAEAVDSLVYGGVVATRWEAVQLGRKLAREHHLFKHVTDSYDFKDDFLFYRFCEADDTDFNSQFFDLDSEDDISLSFTGEESQKNDLAEKADAFRMYVDVRNRKYRLQVMKDVFVGSEAVDSLVFSGLATSRPDAVELGRTLMTDLRLFTTVRGENKFSDNPHSYYRFQDAHLRPRSSDPQSRSVDEKMLAELRTIGEAFQQLVDVKDRRYRFRTYRASFIGAEAVDTMVLAGMAESRIEAVQLGRALARELRLFKHDRDKPFEDSYTFFRFCDPDTSTGSAQEDWIRAMAVSRRPATPKTYGTSPDDNNDSSLHDSSSESDSFAQMSLGMSASSRSDFQDPLTGSARNINDYQGSLLDSGLLDSGAMGSEELEDSFLVTDLEVVPENGNESKSTDFET